MMASMKNSSGEQLWKQLKGLRASKLLINEAEINSHIAHTLSALNSLSQNQLTPVNGKAASDPLTVLDPGLDTLPYLYALNARLDQSSGKTNGLDENAQLGGPLYQNIARFLTLFDPVEVRYAGGLWRRVLDTLATMIQQGDGADCTAPVFLMASAMLRLDPSAGTFTSSHLKYVQICLENGLLAQACLILDNNIHSLPATNALSTEGTFACSSHPLSSAYITTRSGLTENYTLHDVQEYYLSGAMVYIGLKRWSSALFFLELVLSVPSSNAANGYMLEAYKKWTLVSLLVNGKPSSLPKTAGGSSIKTMRALAKPYDVIADVFSRKDWVRLQTEVEEAKEIFNEDGNYGLALHVMYHHRKLSISSLGRIFAAVPLASLPLDVPPDQVEEYINSIINEGILNGQLEEPAEAGGPMVLRFFQDSISGPQAKSETQLRQQLVVQANRIKELAEHVAGVDQRLGLTKEYLDFVRKARKSKEDRGNDEDVMTDVPMSGQLSDEEENVMADAG